MSDFWLNFNHGFHYVVNWNAYAIILFIIVLCAAHDFSAWKKLFVLVTVFTLGHTISSLLGLYNIVKVSSSLIAFLIPVTILIMALFNLFSTRKGQKAKKTGILYIIAAFFGMINGLGFVASFQELDSNNKFLSLLQFELGVEAGQIVVSIIILILAFIFQSIFRFNKRDWILVVSSIVVGILIPMFMDNWIF